jgi:ribosome-associated protein
MNPLSNRFPTHVCRPARLHRGAGQRKTHETYPVMAGIDTNVDQKFQYHDYWNFQLTRGLPGLVDKNDGTEPDMGSSIAPISCNAGCMDLEVSTALTIPTSELGWRFSRSSGPGGQHVNTSDSRVELSWNVGNSAALSDSQRQMLLTRLGRRLIAGVITVTASEQRSQLRNREIALAKLSDLVAAGLAPEAARRRATKPTRGSNRRRLAAKEQRAATKRQRKRPSAE